jgi:hypothetical protein
MKRIFKFLLNHKIPLFIFLTGLYLIFTSQTIIGVGLISSGVALMDANMDEDEIKPVERDVIPTDSEGEE